MDAPAPRHGIIRAQIDVERMRREARSLAASLGFAVHDAESTALAASELATNVLRYAPGGEIAVVAIVDEKAIGIAIRSEDSGPGIADVKLALQDGFSTGGGLGSGLPAVRRLMDHLAVQTGPLGTTIEARKWLIPPSRLP